MSVPVASERVRATCGRAGGPADRYRGVQSATWAMGTLITQHVSGERVAEALVAAEAEIARLEGLLSRFRSTSEISALGRSSGSDSVAVRPETLDVLSQATEFSLMSGGRFDVTVGPVADVWRLGKAESRVPEPSEIERALALVDYRDLILDRDLRTAGLRRAGQTVDVGGIGKGYAADRVLRVYSEHGVESGCLNLGGNVAALGTKPDGSPWRVGIRHPRGEDELLGLVCVADKSVVTSGDYERGFTDREGNYHHHILDPTTGYPSESGLASVTVVADSSTVADALSTVAFLAGFEQGYAFIRACTGVEAIFVDAASQVHLTPGLKDTFQPAEGVDVVVMGAEEMPRCPSGREGKEEC